MKYKVLKLLDKDEFDSRNGTMVCWSIGVEDENGQKIKAQINAKPDGNRYDEGTEFEAELNGTFKDFTKLKRVNPEGGGSSGSSGGGRGGSGGSRASTPRLTYEDAVDLYQRACIDLGVTHTPEHATTLVMSVMRGDVSPPAKAGAMTPGERYAQGHPEDDGPPPPPDDDLPF